MTFTIPIPTTALDHRSIEISFSPAWRVCNDDAAALLLAYLLHEKEVAESDLGFPLDQFNPHDETKAVATLSTAHSTYRSKITILKRLGFIETKLVSKKQTVKIVMAKLQAAIG